MRSFFLGMKIAKKNTKITTMFKSLLLILAFSFLALKPVKSDPPPTGFFAKFIAELRQQLDNTNIVLNPSTDKTLKLRISKNYEIFDSKGKVVKKGSGKEIDVSDLPDGRYTIKFDKDYNQIEYFTKK